jgi:uncharacterized membrane protein YqjE
MRATAGAREPVDGDSAAESIRSDSQGRPGLFQEASLLGRDLRGLVHDHLSLAALEARQAGESLVSMIALGVLVAGLLLSAWFGVLAAAALALMDSGASVSPIAAILVTVVINLLLALVLAYALFRRRRHLQFPATIRSLSPKPAPETEQPP